jgi:hypothetical protein
MSDASQLLQCSVCRCSHIESMAHASLIWQQVFCCNVYRLATPYALCLTDWTWRSEWLAQFLPLWAAEAWVDDV